jgi:signal transduction histidine kinase
MSRQERTDVRRNLHIMRQSTLVTLAVFLIIMIITANFMARHLLTRLRHLNGVVKRVGEGDFSPIMPLRKYKDEFTSLAVTLNHMMEELVTRQEQLIQTRKIAAVGTLTAGIAHEINNPVNNISLVLESLSDPKSVIDEAERQRLLREAMNQTDRVADIVKNLLEFSRSNHPRLKDVSLEELIDVTVSLVSNEMKLREVRFSKQVTDSIPPLYADKGGLQQVFLNMFLNGIQAMPEGGEMTVLLGLTEARDEVKIEIRDTGVGIAPEHLADIFDPFFTTKTETEGTGLGLSVSYSIIDKHGGRIEVESAVGQGTAFIIYLPVDSAEH